MAFKIQKSGKQKTSKSVTVEWKYNFDEELRKKFSKPEWASDVRNIITSMVIPTIEKGISPVSGVGKFEAYKGVAAATGEIKTNKIDMTNMTKAERARARGENKVITDKARKGVYPYSAQGEYPEKKVRPVNLTLSGQMLSYYTARPASAPVTIEVGIFKDQAPNEVVQRAITNNLGLNGVPRRPFIPTDGQDFITKIALEIRKVFANALKKALKR